MATNEAVAAGGNGVPIGQTSQQAANALNPTPVSYTTPTTGLWRGSGDTQGDAVFKSNADGTITQYNVGGASGVANLKSQYGLDFWSLPSYNQGDTFQAAVKAGKLTPNSQGTGYEKGFNIGNLSDFAQPTSNAGSTTVQMNTTQNQLGDIAGATAAQTQQLAGTQGQNVTTQLDSQGNIASSQKTPLGQAPPINPNAPANPNAIPMSGGYFNTTQGGILDSLKAQLLGASDRLTQMGAPPNSEMTKKYNDLFSSAKDTTTPANGGDARAALNDLQKGTSNTSPSQDFLQGYMSLNGAEKQLYDNIQTAINTPMTQTTLAQEYANAMSNTNLPAGIPGESLSQEQMKLMDLKNVMSGTEDDLRAEITKAGGFATESQVQALTTARNKTLLKQATFLQDSMALKQDYVDNLMNFTEKDRASVEAEVDRKIGLEKTQVDLMQNMQNAAQSNYNNIIKTNGFQGLYAALKGSPTAIQAAEQAMGLPSGALKQEADMEAKAASDAAAAKNHANLQYVSGTANQAAGVFDPNTGTFTRSGGSGPSSSGNNSPVATGPNASLVNQVVQNIKQSISSPTKLQAQIIDSIASNPNPLAVITNKAEDIMGQTNATKIQNQINAQAALDSMKGQLDQYYANGGKTDLFTGNMQFVADKLGQVTDPKLVEIATQLQATIQTYRNAISGTAYSVQESNDINNIFPGINKSQAWNEAVLAGRKRQSDTLIASTYDHILGDGMYEALLQAYGPGAASNISKLGSGAASGNVDFGALNTNTQYVEYPIGSGKHYLVAPNGDMTAV